VEEWWTRVGDFFAQFDPYSTENLVLYYGWLVVYTFTLVALWRSQSAWFRLLSFAVNQIFSVGVIMGQVLTAVLAITFWRESLAAFAATAAFSLFLFRRRPQ